MNLINTVIFDMDGLLIDSEKNWFQMYQKMLASYGHDFTLENYTQNYSGKVLKEIVSAMAKNFQLPIQPDEGVEMFLAWEKDYIKKGIDLKEGARELLNYLKANQYKIVLATSSEKERAMEILSLNQVDRFFDDMVFGPEVKRGKPCPDVFLRASEKIGEEPEHCLVLEDSEAGIQASYAAGIPVICIPDVKKPGEAYAAKTTAILSSLTEVIDYLERNREQDEVK